MSDPASGRPVTIRFPARAYEKAHRSLLKDSSEKVGFLLAHMAEGASRRIFLVGQALTLDPACYLECGRTSVSVDPRAKNAVYIRFAESAYSGFINCHSHPFEQGAVRFSEIDDADDLREMAWQVTELPVGKKSFGQSPEIHALSMVFGQKSLDARGYSPGQSPFFSPVEQVQVLGETIRAHRGRGPFSYPI
jgi:hypothetical protein